MNSIRVIKTEQYEIFTQRKQNLYQAKKNLEWKKFRNLKLRIDQRHFMRLMQGSGEMGNIWAIRRLDNELQTLTCIILLDLLKK